jgi:hypothetical protein
MTQPGLTGLCTDWISGADLVHRPGCKNIDADVLASAASIASEILFALSGRQFNGGGCTAVVRPAATPDGLPIWGIGGMGFFSASWGSCSGSSLMAGVPGQYGWFDTHVTCPRPPQIELGAYPVTSITEVLIDGVTIPDDEYRLDNNRVLTRVLPTADAQATQRYGWPVCQRYDLPATQPDTFQVSFTYGVAPSNAGIEAAKVLGQQIALAAIGQTNKLPARVTTVNRQGITAVALDTLDLINKGRTGLFECDMWIKTANPAGLVRRSQAWSPDIGRPRRMG